MLLPPPKIFTIKQILGKRRSLGRVFYLEPEPLTGQQLLP